MTKKEFIDFLEKKYEENNFKDSWDLCQGEISLKENKNILEKEELIIEIKTMYDYVDFNFEFLSAISEILGTKNINIGDKWHYDGCKTCDYGSQYYIELHITDITKPLLKD